MNEPLPTPTKPEPASRDLWHDPRGEACARLPVFRHPLFRKLQPICYLGLPALLLLSLFVSPPQSFLAVLCGSALLLALVWLLLFAAHQHGCLVAWVERAVRRVRGLRFLCPDCLHFGRLGYACGACGAALEPFVIHTRGFYLNDCARCRARVFPLSWPAGTPPNARCNECGSVMSARLHSLRVRVAGVLSPADLQAVAKVMETPMETGWVQSYLFQDYGGERLYLLDVAAVESSGACFSERHAARGVEALWLDGVLEDPLALGETLDRFLRRARISEVRRKALTVFVAWEQLPPAVRNVLEARFSRIETGVSAEAFLALPMRR